MSIELRAIGDDEFPVWCAVCDAAFGSLVTEQFAAQQRSVTELDRTVAAFDADGSLVGTANDYAFDLTLPGGATLPVAGVASVGVLPTHRRRGVLRTMMAHQLEEIARRGEPLAVLNASESSIYGRFGYGLASLHQVWEIPTGRSAFIHPPAVERRIRLVPKHLAAPVIAPIYDAFRRIRPGSLTRSDAWWACMLGDLVTWKGGGDLFVAVADGEGDDPGGYVVYGVRQRGAIGDWTLVLHDLVALHPEVEALLWRYVLDVDLVGTVRAVARPLDDGLRHRLVDPRQIHTTAVQDYLWVRLLDIARALAARAYGTDGTLVLQVEDRFRPSVAGRYRLAVDGGDVACERTDADSDLACEVDAVGATYLGGVSWASLARAGRVQERTPGALRRADALFAWSPQPFCTTKF
ncbi:MAG: GNAT family N-acetyltransferase [Acidimicrobiales bacterium]|jgi:predicted acetyltransferase|nr:GNAT family N-acetyltransferase [Acidimicrobiales bacterium]